MALIWKNYVKCEIFTDKGPIIFTDKGQLHIRA